MKNQIKSACGGDVDHKAPFRDLPEDPPANQELKITTDGCISPSAIIWMVWLPGYLFRGRG
jgi:hypothetical protein